MSWSFTGAPPNEGDHADPLDMLDLFLLTFWLGLRELRYNDILQKLNYVFKPL